MNVVIAAKLTPSRLERARNSVAAFLVGWAAGELFLLVYQLCYGVLSFDWLATGVFTLIFAAPVWFCVMLPLSLFVSPSSSVCRAWVAPLVGAAIALPAIALELALVYPLIDGKGSLYYVGCAFCIGATAWSWFAWLLRQSMSNASR